MHSNRNYSTSLQLQWRAANSPWDPFAVHPIRRSFVAFVLFSAGFILPMAILPPDLEALSMVTFGWLSAIGMVMTLPIFLMSMAEEGLSYIKRRVRPSIDLLDLTPRVFNLLRRYDYLTIDSIDSTSDDSFLLLSNFDPKALHEVRRAINIWKYRRWQEAGFPDDWNW